MRPWLTALLMVAACEFPRPADVPDPDADGPPADASLCFGSFVRVCFDSAADLPTMPRHWGDDGNNVQIDTDIASVCDQHNNLQAAYCVVTGAGMTFAPTKFFRAIGSKPLILLSAGAIDLKGYLSVAGDAGGRAAGADPSGQCAGATPAMGASGGAGGSLGGRGGNGERVNASQGSTSAPRVTNFPAILRGGCSGEPGLGTVLGGAGGSGGGAVAIIAPNLSLDGTINASGGGGRGGGGNTNPGGGGGGGGSGGMIVLDVPETGVVRGTSGVLFANGGGGGQGGDLSHVGGYPGSLPYAPMPAASGGGAELGQEYEGGDGGDGSAGADPDGVDAPRGARDSGGGGGGGGGAGFIHAPGITGGSVISPPSRELPQRSS